MKTLKPKENKKEPRASERKIGSLVFVKTVKTITTLPYNCHQYGTGKTMMTNPYLTGGTTMTTSGTPTSTTYTISGNSGTPVQVPPIYKAPMSKESTTNSSKEMISSLEWSYKVINSSNILGMSQMSNTHGPPNKKTVQPVKVLGTYYASAKNLNGRTYNAITNVQSYATGYKTLNDAATGKITVINQLEKMSSEENKRLGYTEADCWGKPFHGIIVDRFLPSNKSEGGEVLEYPQPIPKLYKVLFSENHLLWCSEEQLTTMTSENKEKKNGSTNQ